MFSQISPQCGMCFNIMGFIIKVAHMSEKKKKIQILRHQNFTNIQKEKGIYTCILFTSSFTDVMSILVFELCLLLCSSMYPNVYLSMQSLNSLLLCCITILDVYCIRCDTLSLQVQDIATYCSL